MGRRSESAHVSSPLRKKRYEPNGLEQNSQSQTPSHSGQRSPSHSSLFLFPFLPPLPSNSRLQAAAPQNPLPLPKQRGGEKPLGVPGRVVPPPQAMDFASCKHWGAYRILRFSLRFCSIAPVVPAQVVIRVHRLAPISLFVIFVLVIGDGGSNLETVRWMYNQPVQPLGFLGGCCTIFRLPCLFWLLTDWVSLVQFRLQPICCY